MSVDPTRLALGHDGPDRRAELRSRGWSAVRAPRVLVLVDAEGQAACADARDGSARLQRVQAPVDLAHDIFLGVDEAGAALCGRSVAHDDPVVPAGSRWAGLRSVGLRLGPGDRAVLSELLALANWHRTHRHCPRCGEPTRLAGLGWWRTCPADGSEHYPRTDPAVIAILTDARGNALLGRQVRWPPGAFSTLAGFVEPGEAAEAAVRREIAEEVGLHPGQVAYVASQPWPFPGSLMLGFRAAVDGERPAPTVDGVEIAEARWLSRDELDGACRSRAVRLPGRLSIAHHLVRSWYGRDIPDEWCRW